jgi:hypothetical protein
MRFFVATVAAALCFCLLAGFLSRTAQAAGPIVTGSFSCKGKLQQLPNGFVGCTLRLPVRHLGKGGPSGGNPNEYGMCGILGVTMNVAEQVSWKDDVQIVVDSAGFYTLQLGISNTLVGVKPPEAQYTCVYFSGFSGLPPISGAVGSTPTPFSSGSSLGSATIPGSADYACIWAGFEGDLAGKPTAGSAVAQGDASAQYFKPETRFSAQHAKSYAFCSGYTAPTWKGWHYVNNSGGSTSTPKSLGIKKQDSWCYMDLIQDNITDFGPVYTVIASINISSSGDYSLGGIFKKGPDSVSMGYNCLPLAQ